MGEKELASARADQTIVCRECRRPFVWSVGEQRSYATHNLTPPKQCRSCRAFWRSPKDERGPRPQEMIDALEAAHAELVLTGHPLAEDVAAALKSGHLAALRAAHTAVAAWRASEGEGP